MKPVTEQITQSLSGIRCGKHVFGLKIRNVVKSADPSKRFDVRCGFDEINFRFERLLVHYRATSGLTSLSCSSTFHEASVVRS